MIRVSVIGAAGRMGTAAVGAIEGAEGLELVGTVRRGESLEGALERFRPDVAVDFTEPECVETHLEALIRAQVCPVVGTTGLSSAGRDRLTALATERQLGGLVAPNFAIGAVLMMQLARRAVRWLPDVEIVEAHHPAKKDAPSGTALLTRELLDRERSASSPIPIHSLRLPGYVASQQVIFGGEGERLTISHDSLDRGCFMPGVVLACRKVGALTTLVFGLEALLGGDE